MNHVINLDEPLRVAEYRSGWNDAARNRMPTSGATIMYMIGYYESKRGCVPRFADRRR